MRRRILTAIVGVTALATIVLTLPLVFLMASREHNDSDRELTLVAEQVANELTSDSDFSASGLELPPIDDALITVGVYLPDGELVAGEGPTPADELTRSAGLLSSLDNVDDHRVLVRPIVEREQKVAVIRVAEPLSEAERKIWRDILVLVGIDAAALIVAAVVGSWVTSRLVRPLRAIRDDAVRLGEGDFSIVPTPSGIDELDATAGALPAIENAASAGAAYPARHVLSLITSVNALPSPVIVTGPLSLAAIANTRSSVLVARFSEYEPESSNTCTASGRVHSPSVR